MNIIEKVKKQLIDRGYEEISDNRFSIEYLGRSRSYLSVLKHNKQEVSVAALAALYSNLKSISNSWKEISDNSASSTASRAHQNYVFFSEIADEVLCVITKRRLT